MSPNKTVTHVFEQVFEQQPTAIFAAPGRVNLIGEHTDYNDGFVLPCPINFYTAVAVSLRHDDKVRVVAADYGNECDEFTLEDELPKSDFFWANYVRGVFAQFLNNGDLLKGLNIVIAGNVPQGAGLSSSAALEVAIACTINGVFGLGYNNTELAKIAQAAENQFVGCACGIMDQLVSAVGIAKHASLIDCRTLASSSIPMNDDLVLLIINSNVKRGLVDSEYNTRRAQCEEAAHLMGVASLRDATLELLNRSESILSPVVYRRAKHVLTENERVHQAARALKAKDIYLLNRLMAESHLSMKDDFEITVPQIDFLVSIIDNELDGEGGVRMTGGGFGGCVVALVPNHKLDAVTDVINRRYYDQTGLVADIFQCTAEQGAAQIG